MLREATAPDGAVTLGALPLAPSHCAQVHQLLRTALPPVPRLELRGDGALKLGGAGLRALLWAAVALRGATPPAQLHEAAMSCRTSAVSPPQSEESECSWRGS